MDLSNNILLGFDVLVNATATVGSTSVPCIYNQSVTRDNKVIGGYEPDDEVTVLVKTSGFENPKSCKGLHMTVDGNEYRIVQVAFGQYVTRFSCQSLNKA